MAEAVRRTKKEALEKAKDEVAELIRNSKCNPIMIRLGWHDAGTYNKVTSGLMSAGAKRVHRI